MNLLQLLRDGEIIIHDEKDPSKIYIVELDLAVVRSDVDDEEHSLLKIRLSVPDVSEFNGNEEARQAKLQQLFDLINEDLIKVYRLNAAEHYLYDKEKHIFTINSKGLRALNEYATANRHAQEIIRTILTLFRLQSKSENTVKEALKALFQSHVIHLEFEQSVMSFKNNIYYYILDPKFGGLNKSHKLGNIILFNIKSALTNIFPQVNSQTLYTKDDLKLPNKYKNTYRAICVKYQMHHLLQFTTGEIPNPTLETEFSDATEPTERAVVSSLSPPSAPIVKQETSGKDKPPIVDLFADDVEISLSLPTPIPLSPVKAAAKGAQPTKSLFDDFKAVVPPSVLLPTPSSHIPSRVPPNREPPAVPVGAMKKSATTLAPDQEAQRDANAKAEMASAVQLISANPARRRLIGSFHGGEVSPVANVDHAALSATNAESAASSSSSSPVSKEGLKPIPVSAAASASVKVPTTSGKPVAVVLDDKDEGSERLRRSLKSAKKAAAKKKSEAEGKTAEEIKQQQESEAAEALAKKNADDLRKSLATPPSADSTTANATASGELKPPPAAALETHIFADVPSAQNSTALAESAQSHAQPPAEAKLDAAAASLANADQSTAPRNTSLAGGGVVVPQFPKPPAQQASRPGDGMLPDDSPLMNNLGPTYTEQTGQKSIAKKATSDNPLNAASTTAPAGVEKSHSDQGGHPAIGDVGNNDIPAAAASLVGPTSEGGLQQSAVSNDDGKSTTTIQSYAKQLEASLITTLGTGTNGSPSADGAPSVAQRLKPKPPTSPGISKGQQPKDPNSFMQGEADLSRSEKVAKPSAKLVPTETDPLSIRGSGTSSPGSSAGSKLQGSNLSASPAQPQATNSAIPSEQTGSKVERGSSISAPAAASKPAALGSAVIKSEPAKKSGGFFSSLFSSSSYVVESPVPISTQASAQHPVITQTVNDQERQSNFAQINNYDNAVQYLEKYIFAPAREINGLVEKGKAAEPHANEIHLRIKQVQEVINKVASLNRTINSVPFEILCNLYIYINAPLQKDCLNVHRRGFFASFIDQVNTNHWTKFISDFQEIAYIALINESKRFEQIEQQIRFLRAHYSDEFITDNVEASDDSTESLQDLLEEKINELTVQEQKQSSRPAAKK